jgi:hypothetical protein
MPGSSARTTSPGERRWRRHVGRMTSRRPIRITGKYAFHASAQSASWTIRVRSSPIAAVRRPGGARGPSRPRPRRGPRSRDRARAGTRARSPVGSGRPWRQGPRRPVRRRARPTSRRMPPGPGSR